MVQWMYVRYSQERPDTAARRNNRIYRAFESTKGPEAPHLGQLESNAKEMQFNSHNNNSSHSRTDLQQHSSRGKLTWLIAHTLLYIHCYGVESLYIHT